VGSESIEFTLPARAENVQLIRHALAGLAETFGMEPGKVADLKTVVTEACMNVVVHAYDDRPGPLEVAAWRDGECLDVCVRDYGRGIRPRVDIERPSLRLGLPLIAALAESFELAAGPEGGTVVTMKVSFSGTNGDMDERESAAVPIAVDEILLNLPAGALLGPVLSRVISMFAVRADFSLDRLSDAVLLTDAISTDDPGDFDDGTARVAIREGDDGEFTVRIGPFSEAAGRRLVEGLRIEDLGVSLDRLADEVGIEEEDGAEHIVMSFSRSGRG
jgi:serine/threonine-protein kinase RsbW